MVLTIKQREFLVEHVFRNGGKYLNTVQKKIFQAISRCRGASQKCCGTFDKKILPNWRCKRRSRTGRPLTTNEKAMEIQEIIMKSPKKSL